VRRESRSSPTISSCVALVATHRPSAKLSPSTACRRPCWRDAPRIRVSEFRIRRLVAAALWQPIAAFEDVTQGAVAARPLSRQPSDRATSRGRGLVARRGAMRTIAQRLAIEYPWSRHIGRRSKCIRCVKNCSDNCRRRYG
jgi:hypothetical protein